MRNDIIWICGRHGSGKTTLLRKIKESMERDGKTTKAIDYDLDLVLSERKEELLQLFSHDCLLVDGYEPDLRNDMKILSMCTLGQKFVITSVCVPHSRFLPFISDFIVTKNEANQTNNSTPGQK